MPKLSGKEKSELIAIFTKAVTFEPYAPAIDALRNVLETKLKGETAEEQIAIVQDFITSVSMFTRTALSAGLTIGRTINADREKKKGDDPGKNKQWDELRILLLCGECIASKNAKGLKDLLFSELDTSAVERKGYKIGSGA